MTTVIVKKLLALVTQAAARLDLCQRVQFHCALEGPDLAGEFVENTWTASYDPDVADAFAKCLLNAMIKAVTHQGILKLPEADIQVTEADLIRYKCTSKTMATVESIAVLKVRIRGQEGKKEVVRETANCCADQCCADYGRRQGTPR
jgi:hypothetical protein